MANPFYLSLRPLLASEWTISVTIGVDTDVIAIPAGRYFNDSFTAADSLAAVLQAALDTHSSAGAGFTVLYDLAAGEFTISHAGVFSVTWPSTAMRDWLGFSGVLGGGNSYTSDQVAQGTIFADTGRSNWPGRQYHWQVGQTKSQAGPVAIIGTGTRTVTSSWDHPLEPSAGVASPLASGARDDDSSVVPWTWADFYAHHLGNYVGEPFRFYALTTDGINDWEDEYQLVDIVDFGPARGEAEVDAYWTIRVVVADYVVST